MYRKWLSPFLHAFGQVTLGVHAGCRFEESCSHYSERVIREVGLLRGIMMSAKRVWSCY